MSRQVPLGVSVLLLASGAALAPAGDPPPARGPISVFVQPRADEAAPSKPEMDERKAKSEALSKSLDQLEKDLKKQYGKDVKKWPEDKRGAYYDALDTLGMAWSANYYAARPAKEKGDSVLDLNKRLGKESKNAYVVLAERPEDADLVVEILGRKGQAKFVVGNKYLGFDVLAGKIAPETLARLPREFRPWHADHLSTLHWAKSGEPYLRFEVWDTERWQDVAGYVGHTLEELVKANYDLLRPAQ